jgi:hypothetical protein
MENARNQIGARPIVPVEFHEGEPGIRKGQ